MTSKKIDQFMMALGLVLIIISSYQLLLWRMDTQADGFMLATLEQTQAVVKLKSFTALDWQDGFPGFGVQDKQLIFTDKNSSAALKFSNGNTITIGENSLIRLSSKETAAGLNVERGIMRAHVTSKEPLVVMLNGEEYKLTATAADVQISLVGQVAEIGVISGELSVENDGHLEILNKQYSLEIEGDQLTRNEVKIERLSPLPDEVFYTSELDFGVVFSWSPDNSAEVLLADNPVFKKARVFTGEGQARAQLVPGTYYWKVEDESGSSLGASFKIVKEIPPMVLRPLSGEKIILVQQPNKPSTLLVQWKGVPGEDYLVQWSREKTFQQKVTGSGLLIPVNQNGNLNWRIKIDDPKRSSAQWSEWQNIDVTLIALPEVPVKILPEELELQTYTHDEMEVFLSWEANGKVEIEIINPKQQQTLLTQAENTYLLKVKEPGEYKWRVRGKDLLNRSSEWSPWKNLTLVDLSAEVSSEGFQRIQLKKPDQSVTFSWKAEQGTKTVFELSQVKDFSEVIIKKEVNSSEVSVTIPKIGDYYWRSREYKADGTYSVSEPKKVIIEPAPAPEKPQKLPDLEVPLEWKETKILKQKWWHFFISEAYADDFQTLAKIQLPANEDAKKFVVKIFSDKEATALVYETTTENNIIEWSGAKPGQYYWQYAVVDFWGRESLFSDLSFLTVTGVSPVLPKKPILLFPLKDDEVESKRLEFKWSGAKENKKYRFDLSDTKDFKKILIQRTGYNTNLILLDRKLEEGTYYWRVVAGNDLKKEAFSEPQTLKIVPDLEKITIVDGASPPSWTKVYSKRFSLAWAPSMDSYDFEEEDQKAKIDGNTLNSFEARALKFSKNVIYSADVTRQSGTVFEGEEYLFQRGLIHIGWKRTRGNHLWAPGISAGFVSGMEYQIQNQIVSSSSISGIVYGPHLQAFYSLNPKWEIQWKVMYLLGAIPHLEACTEANRYFKSFYFLIGAGMSNREYANEGTQSSLKLNLGLGKEF